MITEDYVSFEVAKLLKEKGFSENTEHESWYVIKQFSTSPSYEYACEASIKYCLEHLI